MKKLLLVSIPALFASALSAQSFTFVDHDQNAVANGSTIVYYVDQSISTETHDFEVTNTSGNSITTKVRKAVQQSQAGQTFYFCTDQNCYAPSTVLSISFNVASQGAFQLLTDFTPNNTAGVSIVRYSVFDVNNPNDSAYFTIEYHVSPTGIANHSMVKANIGNPMPNPAAAVFNMNYNLGSSYGSGAAKLVVYNMLGDVVKSENIMEAEGTFRMDVSTLDNGVYFTSLEVDGKQLSTKRLVVSH